MRKTIILCLVMATVLTGCGFSSETANMTNQTTTATATDQNKAQFIMGGKIAANSQADITSKISAKVVAINVEVGSKVNQGDVLINLDTKDLQAQVDQAQAAVTVAKANLSKAQSTQPEQIATAQASLDSANASYVLAEKNYNRTKSLVDAGGAPQQQLDSASQQLAAAKAQKQSAEQQVTLSQNTSSVTVCQAQVEQAEAALKSAQVALANGDITAPISGKITAKNIEVGELTSSGKTLVSIVNASGFCVNAYAPLEITKGLKEGQEVLMKVSELPNEQFKGKILVINSTLSEQSSNVLVKVSIEDAKSLLKPGMFAQIGLAK